MVIPAVALKFLGGVVACGALASSIAVPTVMSMNAPAGLVLEGFPENQKQDFKDKCQMLIKKGEKGKSDDGYLLACKGEDGYEPKFYFYSYRDVPTTFTNLRKKGESKNGQLQITITLDGTSNMEVDFFVPSVTWEKFINGGKGLGECGIVDKENEKKQWALRCPKDGSDSVEFPLTPVIIY